MNDQKTEFMDYLNVIWKKKWLIFIPTLLCVLATGMISFFLRPLWEVDCLIQPARFYVQTTAGNLQEIFVVDPQQLASQISRAGFQQRIADDLKLDLHKIPGLQAEAVQNTKLVAVSARTKDAALARSALNSLLVQIKEDYDKKIDVEIGALDAQIATQENLIKNKEIVLKDKQNEIKLQEIEKNKTIDSILTAENKLKISETRVLSLREEMKAAATRIQDLEKQQQNALAEGREPKDAVSLLLYSNEVQQNLRYLNSLGERERDEKVLQEDLNLSVKQRKQGLKELDTKKELTANDMEKIRNEMENVKNEIELLKKMKTRMDFVQFAKDPTPSVRPVAPRKVWNMAVAGILSLAVFLMVAFLADYIETKRGQP